jgi:hypothetical protein
VKVVVEGGIYSSMTLSEIYYPICAKLAQWYNKVIAIAYNANAFDSQFILKRAIFLKWTPHFILTGLKIICMKMQHIHFLDFVSYLPMPLRKLLEALGLSSSNLGSLTTLIPRQILAMWAPYPTSSISELMR